MADVSTYSAVHMAVAYGCPETDPIPFSICRSPFSAPCLRLRAIYTQPTTIGLRSLAIRQHLKLASSTWTLLVKLNLTLKQISDAPGTEWPILRWRYNLEKHWQSLGGSRHTLSHKNEQWQCLGKIGLRLRRLDLVELIQFKRPWNINKIKQCRLSENWFSLIGLSSQ